MKTKSNYDDNTPPNQLIEPFPEIRTFPTGWGDLSIDDGNIATSNDELFVSELDNNATEALI